MKRILPIALCMVLLFGVLVVPVLAGDIQDIIDGKPYEFWDGYSYSLWIEDKTEGVADIYLHHYLSNPDSSGYEKIAFITYTSTNGAYLYIANSIRYAFDIASGYYGIWSYGTDSYFYQNGHWEYVKTDNAGVFYRPTIIKWVSDDLYHESSGELAFSGDPNFLPVPPVPMAEQIQGVAEEHLMEEALPKLGTEVMTIVTIAVGCLALVIGLLILVKVLRTASRG